MTVCLATFALASDASELEKLLMPGPLSAAHAEHEAECSKCHDRTDKPRQRQLCLDCHKDRQLFDPVSCTYTYLLADASTRRGLLIDTVFEQFDRDRALVHELGVTLTHTLETHVHADHVTAAWRFHRALGSKSVLSRRSGATGADVYVDDGDVIEAGTATLIVRSTLGHTDGCVTYVTRDLRMAFTGDALLIRSAGRTEFQQGSAHELYRSIKERIFTLPDECLLYPAHDYAGRTVTTVGEEKRWNPRIGGEASESDFTGYMDNLGLPHPKLSGRRGAGDTWRSRSSWTLTSSG